MTAQIDAKAHNFEGRLVMYCTSCRRDFPVNTKGYDNRCPYCKAFLTVWTCNRCNHTWSPKNIALTNGRVCPRCKSPYWNREKIR